MAFFTFAAFSILSTKLWHNLRRFDIHAKILNLCHFDGTPVLAKFPVQKHTKAEKVGKPKKWAKKIDQIGTLGSLGTTHPLPELSVFV